MEATPRRIRISAGYGSILEGMGVRWKHMEASFQGCQMKISIKSQTLKNARKEKGQIDCLQPQKKTILLAVLPFLCHKNI